LWTFTAGKIVKFNSKKNNKKQTIFFIPKPINYELDKISTLNFIIFKKWYKFNDNLKG